MISSWGPLVPNNIFMGRDWSSKLFPESLVEMTSVSRTGCWPGGLSDRKSGEQPSAGPGKLGKGWGHPLRLSHWQRPECRQVGRPLENTNLGSGPRCCTAQGFQARAL